jgi:hypothetical protein
MEQPGLFDPAQAAEAANEALAKVEAHADPDWKDRARGIIHELARVRVEFTTDDVWKELALAGVETHEPRALGALMREAAGAHIIAATDRYRPSARVACHGRPVRVWRSRRA